jgi:hypothetical protein
MASLPDPGNELRFTVAGAEFVFEIPASYWDIAEVFQKATEWKAVCSKGFPANSELSKWPVPETVAEDIGAMVACIKSPTWGHLEFMKLATERGQIYGEIRTRFNKWVHQSLDFVLTSEVVEQKKD